MHAETSAAPDVAASDIEAPGTVARARCSPARRLGLAGAAALLAAACSLAQASDGTAGAIDACNELNPTQLDRVAAGLQQSGSAATAGALLGFATTASTTYATKTGPIQSTGATSVGISGGIGATATATAATRFR